DGGTPTLTITQAQVAADADILAKVQGPFDLLVTGASGTAPETGTSGPAPHYSSYEQFFDASNTLTQTIYFNDNGTQTVIPQGTTVNLDDSAATSNQYVDLSGTTSATVTGGSGNDGFYFGAAFNASDIVDGAGGTNNQIGLDGDYSAGVVL